MEIFRENLLPHYIKLFLAYNQLYFIIRSHTFFGTKSTQFIKTSIAE